MKKIFNKRGSYIVEAGMVLPILILSMICLVSIVSMYSTGENVFFSSCDEVLLSCVKSSVLKESISLPASIMLRARSENPNLSYVAVTDYGYLYDEGYMSDLISIEVSGKHKSPASMFFIDNLISERIMGRAFTGLYKPTPQGDSMLDGEDADIVYVFPMRGEKYHNRECAFLNPACQRVFLTQDIKNKYSPCSICKSGNSKIGESVYCFFNTGEVYHTGKCSQVDKYYVEMDKKDALQQGYMPCVACGG